MSKKLPIEFKIAEWFRFVPIGGEEEYLDITEKLYQNRVHAVSESVLRYFKHNLAVVNGFKSTLLNKLIQSSKFYYKVNTICFRSKDNEYPSVMIRQYVTTNEYLSNLYSLVTLKFDTSDGISVGARFLGEAFAYTTEDVCFQLGRDLTEDRMWELEIQLKDVNLSKQLYDKVIKEFGREYSSEQLEYLKTKENFTKIKSIDNVDTDEYEDSCTFKGFNFIYLETGKFGAGKGEYIGMISDVLPASIVKYKEKTGKCIYGTFNVEFSDFTSTNLFWIFGNFDEILK